MLVLSMHDEKLYADAPSARHPGYIMKQEVSDRLLSAVRTVLSGKVYISETMNALLVQRMVGGKNSIDKLPMDRLTDRELEVFRMIGEGMSVKEIAEKLYLGAKTVEAHREHIKKN